MWNKTKDLARLITAMMLLCSILPQQTCLQCAMSPNASCPADIKSCSCGHTTQESEEGPNKRAPIQLPLDDSNCPHCDIKSIGALLSPTVEIRQSTQATAHVASDTQIALVFSRVCNVDITLRPPATNMSCLHLRI